MVNQLAGVRCALRFLVPMVCLITIGCQGLIWESEDPSKRSSGAKAAEAESAQSASHMDSIGSFTYVEGLAPMRVRGYGLVVGLAHNGSRDCPKSIFDRLVQELHKQHQFSSGIVGESSTSPERLIRQLDTAVVLVQADIPPAATSKSRFDVSVTALPGTQTKSLRGGRLISTDLEVYRDVSPGKSIKGRTLARAIGPVFVNPFSDEQSATKSDPRRAIIVGGGRTTEPRRIRLVVTQPSYARARAIRDTINARFPSDPPVADATSRAYIRLTIPDEYVDDEAHFLQLVQRLFLSRTPGFQATRLRALATEILFPDAPHAQIALAWEGIGNASLPTLNKLYAHPRDFVSFYAAAAGLRLGDHIAGDAMALHAGNSDSAYCFPAIRALGKAKRMAGAGMTLRGLLRHTDPRVQIAAYEALAARNDITVSRKRIGEDNYILAVVPSAASNFIYAKRRGSREIVLFGHDLRSMPPLFYRAPDGRLMVTANEGDRELTVMRKILATGTISPKLSAPLSLAGFIEMMGRRADVNEKGQATGLGLDYGAVVRTIYHLCEDEAINAKFMLEQPPEAEHFTATQPEGRPEAE